MAFVPLEVILPESLSADLPVKIDYLQVILYAGRACNGECSIVGIFANRTDAIRFLVNLISQIRGEDLSTGTDSDVTDAMLDLGFEWTTLGAIYEDAYTVCDNTGAITWDRFSLNAIVKRDLSGVTRERWNDLQKQIFG